MPSNYETVQLETENHPGWISMTEKLSKDYHFEEKQLPNLHIGDRVIVVPNCNIQDLATYYFDQEESTFFEKGQFNPLTCSDEDFETFLSELPGIFIQDIGSDIDDSSSILKKIDYGLRQKVNGKSLRRILKDHLSELNFMGTLHKRGNYWFYDCDS